MKRTILSVLFSIAALTSYAGDERATKRPTTGWMPPLPPTHLINVPNFYQRASQMCWAASMQMILGFHQVTIDQCNLYQILRRNSPVPAAACAACATDFYSTSNNYNAPMGGTSELGQFRRVFSGMNFYCTEDQKQLSWTTVKRQLKNCRPFILALNTEIQNIAGGADTVASSNHAVVVRGFKGANAPGYISVIDPLSGPCNSRIHGFNYQELLDPESIHHIKYSVHNIYQKDKSECCSSCKPSQILQSSPTSPDFLDRAEQFRAAMAAPMYMSFSQAALDMRINGLPGNRLYPFYVISASKLLSQPQSSIITLSQIVSSHVLAKVVFRRFPNIQLTTVIQRKGNRWKDIRISPTDIPLQLQFSTVDSVRHNYLLSSTIPAKVEMVEYPLLSMEFYSVLHNGLRYLIPVNTYKDTDPKLLLVQKVALPEDAVLKILALRTRKYYSI